MRRRCRSVARGGAALLLKGKRRQPDENFVLPTGSRVHLRKIPGKCLYCAHNDNGSRSIRGKKICIDWVSGFGFLRIREDQTSEHEGIYRCDFLPSLLLVQKFCFNLSCILCDNFSFLFSGFILLFVAKKIIKLGMIKKAMLRIRIIRYRVTMRAARFTSKW